MTKFVHKQNIIESFGLQKWRFLSLIFLVIVSIAASYLYNADNQSLFFSIVWTPIPEEIFFRGYLLGRLKNMKATKKFNFAFVILVSLIFSLSHLFNPNIGIFNIAFWLLLLGIFLGVLYWRTGSILPSSIAHTIWNFFSLTSGIFSFEFCVFLLFSFVVILCARAYMSPRKTYHEEFLYF
jgi:membrane protease YdiL (CAAX protease family)